MESCEFETSLIHIAIFRSAKVRPCLTNKTKHVSCTQEIKLFKLCPLASGSLSLPFNLEA